MDKDIDTVDLRRKTRGAGGERPPGSHRFYLVVLVLTGVAALGAVVLEVARSVTAADLPVARSSFTDGDEDTPAGWRVVEVVPTATALRGGDLIVELEGVPALSVARSDSTRRRLDGVLRRGAPLAVRVVRQPDFRTRPFWRWTFMSARGGGGGPYVRSVVLDSSRAGQGLEATVRGLDPTDPAVCGGAGSSCPPDTPWLGRIPPGLDLAAAEAALVAHDPTLRVLPEGSEVQLGVRGDDLARPVLAVTPPAGVAVQVEETRDGWVTIPAGTSTQELALVRRPWTGSLASLSLHLVILLIPAVGVLSLRARERSPAVAHFVSLCALLSLSAPLALRQAWAHWARPLSPHLTFGDQYFAYRMADGSWQNATVVLGQHLVGVALGGLALGLVLHSALRLLHTFPSPDPALEARYRVPRRALLVAAAVAAAAAGVFLRGTAGGNIMVWRLASLLFLINAFMLGLLVMLVQITRLAAARRRQTHMGEDGAQARLALTGLALGSILLLVTVVLPGGYLASIPWTVHLYDAVQKTRSVLGPLALAIPFLGFFLAIAKRGLWDVDLIVQRATLYSTLTAVFLVAWVILEASVESLLSESLGRVPVVGGLAPALLAAGAVAVSRRSVSDFLANRLRPPGRPFGEVIQLLADELSGFQDPDGLPARVVSRLTELLESGHCALFLREGPVWRCWRSDPAGPMAVCLAAALGALESSRHVVVSTESGPSLVTRIDGGGSTVGALVLGGRPVGAFYSREDRRLLSLLLGALAPRLPARGGPGAS